MPTATADSTETQELLEKKQKIDLAIQLVNSGLSSTSKEAMQTALKELEEEMDKGGDLFRTILTGEIKITRGDVKHLIKMESFASKKLVDTSHGVEILSHIRGQLLDLLSHTEKGIDEKPTSEAPVLPKEIKNDPVIKAFISGRQAGVTDILRDRTGKEWTVKKGNLTEAKTAIFGSDLRDYNQIAEWMMKNGKSSADLQNLLVAEVKKTAKLKSAPPPIPKNPPKDTEPVTTEMKVPSAKEISIAKAINLTKNLSEFSELKETLDKFYRLGIEQRREISLSISDKTVFRLLKIKRSDGAMLIALTDVIDGHSEEEIKVSLTKIAEVIQIKMDEAVSAKKPSSIPPKRPSDEPPRERINAEEGRPTLKRINELAEEINSHPERSVILGKVQLYSEGIGDLNTMEHFPGWKQEDFIELLKKCNELAGAKEAISKPKSKRRRLNMKEVDKLIDDLKKSISTIPPKKKKSSSKPGKPDTDSQPETTETAKPANFDEKVKQMIIVKKKWPGAYIREIEKIKGWIADGIASGEGSKDFEGWSKSDLVAFLEAIPNADISTKPPIPKTSSTPKTHGAVTPEPTPKPITPPPSAPPKKPSTPKKTAEEIKEELKKKRELNATALAQGLGELDKNGDVYKANLAQLRLWVEDGKVSSADDNIKILTVDNVKGVLIKLGEKIKLPKGVDSATITNKADELKEMKRTGNPKFGIRMMDITEMAKGKDPGHRSVDYPEWTDENFQSLINEINKKDSVKPKTKAELANERLEELDKMAKADTREGYELKSALIVLSRVEKYRGMTELEIMQAFGDRDEAKRLKQWLAETHQNKLENISDYFNESVDTSAIASEIRKRYWTLEDIGLRVPLIRHFNVPKRPAPKPKPKPSPDAGPKKPKELPDFVKPDNLRTLVAELCGDNQDKKDKFVVLWEIAQGNKEIDSEADNKKIVGVLNNITSRTQNDKLFQQDIYMFKMKINQLLKIDTSSIQNNADAEPETADVQGEYGKFEKMLLRVTFSDKDTNKKIRKIFKMIKLNPDDIDEKSRDMFSDFQDEFKQFLGEKLASIYKVETDNEDDLIKKILELKRDGWRGKTDELKNALKIFDDDIDTYGYLIEEKEEDSNKDKKDGDGGADGGANGGADKSKSSPDSGTSKMTASPEVSEIGISKMMKKILEKKEQFHKHDPASLAISKLILNDETIKKSGITELKNFLLKPKTSVNLAVSDTLTNLDESKLQTQLNAKLAEANSAEGDKKIALLTERNELELALALKIDEAKLEKMMQLKDNEIDDMKEEVLIAKGQATRMPSKMSEADIKTRLTRYRILKRQLNLLVENKNKFKKIMDLKDGTMEYGSTAQVLSMIQVYIAKKEGSKLSMLDISEETDKLIQVQRRKALGKLTNIASGTANVLYGVASGLTLFKQSLSGTLESIGKDPKFSKIKPEDWKGLAKAHNNFGAVESWFEGLDGGVNDQNMKKTLPRIMAYLEMALHDGNMRYIGVISAGRAKNLIGHMKTLQRNYIKNKVKASFRGKESTKGVDMMNAYFEELNSATVSKDEISKKILRWKALKTSALGITVPATGLVGGGAFAMAGLAAKLGVLGGGASITAGLLGSKFKNEKVKKAFKSAAVRGLATTGLAVGAAALNPLLLPAALAGVFSPEVAKMMSTKEGRQKAVKGAKMGVGAGVTTVGTTVKTGWWAAKLAAKVGVIGTLAGLPLLLPHTWRWLGGSVPSWIKNPIAQRMKAPKMEMPSMPDMGGAMPEPMAA